MTINVNIPGWMGCKELAILEKLAKQVPKGGVMVEVGSFCGRSSYTLAKSCDPSATLHCFDAWADPWEGHLLVDEKSYDLLEPKLPFPYGEPSLCLHSEFLKYTSDCTNIISTKGKCPEETNWVGGPIDLCFIDSDHHYQAVIDTFKYFKNFLRPSSIISGHDFSEQFPGTIKAVREISLDINRDIRLFEGSSIWQLV